jgi:hypothetical protein
MVFATPFVFAFSYYNT